jgi:hypothetical protein
MCVPVPARTQPREHHAWTPSCTTNAHLKQQIQPPQVPVTAEGRVGACHQLPADVWGRFLEGRFDRRRRIWVQGPWSGAKVLVWGRM